MGCGAFFHGTFLKIIHRLYSAILYFIDFSNPHIGAIYKIYLSNFAMWAQRHTTLAKQNAEAALRLARDRYRQPYSTP